MPAMPPLAKPFAAFGAAAGLFAILGVGAFRDAAREVSPYAPMMMTAIVGALAGETLRRWPRLHDPKLAREAVAFWVGIVSSTAGLVSGALVGFYTWGEAGMFRFGLGGAAVGLAFTPSCLVVFDSAKRAARGRHGSLVAATDRRTVLSTVLAGIAFAGATQVPAVLSTNLSDTFTPKVQVGLSFLACVAATIAIVVLQRLDRKDRAAVEAHAKNQEWLERASNETGGSAPAANAAAPIDLGLGSDSWTRANDSNDRTSGRPDVVLRGSITDAMAAFDEGFRRRHHSLIVAACSLSAVTMSFVLRMSVYL